MPHPGKELALEKMTAAGLSQPAISAFGAMYDRFVSGEKTLIPESAIEPIEAVQHSSNLPRFTEVRGGTETGEACGGIVNGETRGGSGTSEVRESSETSKASGGAGINQNFPNSNSTPETAPAHHAPELDAPAFAAPTAFNNETAVLRLSGGIGTTMGLQTPKVLLPARGDHSFISVICKQIEALRDSYGARLPLIFLNSPATEAAISEFPGLLANPDGIPLSILQGVVPRIDAQTLEPITCPNNWHDEWAPPGHGDVYGVIVRSGLLTQLMEHGYKYLFVANGDNLGGMPEPELAQWFAQSGADFAAEVVTRTPMEIKGGHFARMKSSNRLVLRELAQTPAPDIDYFQDITRHRYLNTNNLWINLAALADIATDRGLELPLIANHKECAHGEVRDAIQLETAMGSAISSFENTRLLEVPIERFLPVKNTSDLLLLRSDVYRFDDSYRLIQQPVDPPVVTLDPKFFGSYAEFSRRIPEVPSLRQATSFSMQGDTSLQPGFIAVDDVAIHPER